MVPAYDSQARDGGDSDVQPEVEGWADGDAAHLLLGEVVIGEAPRLLLLQENKKIKNVVPIF